MNSEQLTKMIPFFDSVTLASVERLRSASDVRTLAKGATVWREGDDGRDFYFVLRGRAKLTKAMDSGRDAIMELMEPGNLMCASVPCARAAFCCSAVALDDGIEVLKVPGEQLMSLMDGDPSVAASLIDELSRRGVNSCERVEELSNGRVEQRIARLLLKLAERGGVELDGGIWVAMPLSRQDLADLCNTTIESASRTVSRWSSKNILKANTRGFLILDVPELEVAARGPSF